MFLVKLFFRSHDLKVVEKESPNFGLLPINNFEK